MSTATRGRPALIEALEGRTLLTTLAHGVDPNNMGKGDWIWQVSSAESNTGTTTVAGLMSYLKAQGIKFVIVKAGDGDSGPVTGSWTQFNTRLIDAAHTAGLKIFGYHFIYGGANGSSTQAGEKKVAREIMSLNPDGMVIDAEGSYETVPDNQTVAADYCKSFRALYPTTFLAHAPFAYASLHRAFPYEAFNKYCDVIMPQDYWFTISRAQTPARMVADMDREGGGL